MVPAAFSYSLSVIPAAFCYSPSVIPAALKLISFIWEKLILADVLKNLLHNNALTIQVNCVVMILNSLTQSVNNAS